MDNEADKRLDEFTGKLLKDLLREVPSLDFTTRVMSQVEVLSKSRKIEYKPLISKTMWWVLGVLVCGFFAYSILGNLRSESSWGLTSIFDSLPEMNSFTLPDFKISNIFLYAVVGFAFFIGVQIFHLKNHFNKRFVLH